MNFKEWLVKNEGISNKVANHFQSVGMPKGKQKHSIRVMQAIKKAGAGRDARMAALFHDYIERGGDIGIARRMFKLSDRVTNIIQHLSDPEKMDSENSPENAPLAHIQAILSDTNISPDEKSIVIVIKIADRLDNLLRRIKAKNLGKGYVEKSRQLLNFLFTFYFNSFGKDETVKRLFRQMKGIDAQIKKPIGLAKPWKQPQAVALQPQAQGA